jgi:hypothetical protein
MVMTFRLSWNSLGTNQSSERLVMREIRFTELLLNPRLWIYCKGGREYYACSDVRGEGCGCCGGGRCCDDEDGIYPIIGHTPSTLILDESAIDADALRSILNELKIDVTPEDRAAFNALLEAELKDLYSHEFTFKDAKISIDCARCDDGDYGVIVSESSLFTYYENPRAKGFFESLFKLYKDLDEEK